MSLRHISSPWQVCNSPFFGWLQVWNCNSAKCDIQKPVIPIGHVFIFSPRHFIFFLYSEKYTIFLIQKGIISHTLYIWSTVQFSRQKYFDPMTLGRPPSLKYDAISKPQVLPKDQLIIWSHSTLNLKSKKAAPHSPFRQSQPKIQLRDPPALHPTISEKLWNLFKPSSLSQALQSYD